jgi:selenocysteine-specific elongation factor
MNLAGLKKTDVQRGDTVARPDTVKTSRMLDVRLQNLKNSQRTILTQSQVHFYHGASVMLAKVVLLDRESLLPGDSCYAQLRLTEPLASKRGDRFVIRFYSPLETIGGGVILDEAPLRHKAGDSAVLEALAIRESGSGNQKLVQVIAGFGYALPNKQKLCGELNLEEAELQEQLEELVQKTGIAQHSGLQDLDKKEVRHSMVCEKEGISAAVQQILGL